MVLVIAGDRAREVMLRSAAEGFGRSEQTPRELEFPYPCAYFGICTDSAAAAMHDVMSLTAPWRCRGTSD